MARRTLASLAAQTYPNMRVLVLAEGKGVKEPAFRAQLLDGFSALDKRVDILKRSTDTFHAIIGAEASECSKVPADVNHSCRLDRL